MSIKVIKERRYHSLDSLDRQWLDLFGDLERNFRMIIYGAPTSGKSSLALMFANHLAKKIGKVLYNSWEEGLNKTVQSRITERGIDAPKLYVADRMPFDELVRVIKSRSYRVVVIDSVKFMDFTYIQYKKLTSLYPHKSFVFLAHGEAQGRPEGAADIHKACDVKVFVKHGQAKVVSRYLGQPTSIKLFDYHRSPALNGQKQMQLK